MHLVNATKDDSPVMALNEESIRLSGISMANKDSQLAMIDYLEKTNIKPVISDTFDLSELAAAFQHQIDNKHFGKISITMG